MIISFYYDKLLELIIYKFFYRIMLIKDISYMHFIASVCEMNYHRLLKEMENNMADIVRKHIIFHGSVQGVGFRYYSEHKANQLRLTGWVKNLYNGDVEMEVQGSEAAIDELVAFLAGRRFVQITGMDVKKLDVVEDERSFGID